MNLPLDRVITPFEDPMLDIQLDNKSHREHLQKKASDVGIKIIIVDSLSGSNQRDENKKEISEIVKFLAELARDLNKPIILNHHLNKASPNDNSKTIAINRLRGSSAITQFARVIWAIDAPIVNEPEIKRLSVIKSNLGGMPEPIGFTVKEGQINFIKLPTEQNIEKQEDKAFQILMNLLI